MSLVALKRNCKPENNKVFEVAIQASLPRLALTASTDPHRI